MTLFNANRLSEAEALYTQLLTKERKNDHCLHMLGVIALKTNRLQLAVTRIAEAITLNPTLAGYYSNLAVALTRLGRVEESVANYEKALRLAPNLLAAQNGLFVALNKIVPSWHIPMMNEQERNDAYYHALRSAIKPKSTVFEIGTGGGLLALMAAKLGATVTTCEMRSWLADTARQVISDNGFQDQIMVLEQHSAEVNIDRVDILVSEIFSSELLGEGVLPSIEDAKRRLLKPRGTVIPAVGSIMIALVGGDNLRRNLLVENFHEFNFRKFNSRMPRKRILSRPDLDPELLSSGTEVFRFNFQCDSYFPPEKKSVELNPTVKSRCYGVIQWIRFEMGDVVYENHPSHRSKVLNWRQCVHLFDDPIDIHPNQSIKITATHNRVNVFFFMES
jgi:tetratricopeptide (TPR) repeat protein